ncbi:hypothetical protein NM688_g6415 [Phlebia brevispora]|uniref:Uncharacterized protein n=1 Tax=Phlebia brevispora TaxID=194682 RepID=A0ACC1SG66_9APHY|nr:hypothetical protein NM688_g6415 [Phlebia brevispora]
MRINASIPIHRGMEKLDKDAFRKSIDVLAAEVAPATTHNLLKAPEMRGVIIDLPKIKSVVPAPEGKRLVLTRFTDESDLSLETKQYLESQSAKLVNHTINLDYDYWTADDILSSILPAELVEGAPSGYAMVGHIAHLNLNDEYLPYKYIIGQAILDASKNAGIKTVVNKLDSISNQFRVFKMELLAGEPNYVVEHHEADCRFTFDFSEVYWNSRLHTEHSRLVEQFKPEDVVADVFAGVGPFAIPAAKKGCGVFANDLNPNSFKYLSKNITDNRVHQLVRASCEDGRDFIRRVVSRALADPLPSPEAAVSKTQVLKAEKAARKLSQLGQLPPKLEVHQPKRSRITQFVMNLPDSAITFLDAFRGVLSPENNDGRDLSGLYKAADLPMVNCYCFTRELEIERAEKDIRERVEEKIGHPLGGDVSLHYVRSVAPTKEMYCISFRLPGEVAFGS